MSGIAGILSLDRTPVETEPAERMAAMLGWRGTHDDGSYRSPDGRAALAAHRQEGIDASDAAALPMANETHDVWLVLDGEILNYRTLRHSLELVGHRFRSGADGEVALHAYEQWDLDFLDHLQGAFALALWDDRRDRLVLARDRLGRKPLFVAESRGRLGFASGIAPLLEEMALPRRLDPLGLTLHLHLGFVPAPRTIVHGITKLVPGEMLVADRDRAPRRLRWGVCEPEGRRVAAVRGLPLDRHAANVRTLLECSVADRLIGDGPVGVKLAPRAASAAIAAIAGRLAGRPAQAVAVVDADAPDGDAARDIRLLAQAARAELSEIRVSAEDAAHCLPVLARCLPEPVADCSAPSSWFAARAAAEAGLDALMFGDGADVVLLAHPAYQRCRQSGPLARLRRLLPPLERMLAREIPGMPETILPAPLLPFPDGGGGLVEAATATSLPHPAWDPGPIPPWTAGDPLEALGLRDLRWRVADSLSPRADAMALAHGIEARLPFLDDSFVSYVLAIPGLLRSPAGAPHQMLKRSLGDLVPPPFCARAADPPPLPLHAWMAEGLGARLGDMLDRSGLVRSGVVAAAPTRAMLVRHRAEGGNAHGLWAMLVLLEWADALGLDQLADGGEHRVAHLAHSRS